MGHERAGVVCEAASPLRYSQSHLVCFFIFAFSLTDFPVKEKQFIENIQINNVKLLL